MPTYHFSEQDSGKSDSNSGSIEQEATINEFEDVLEVKCKIMPQMFKPLMHASMYSPLESEWLAHSNSVELQWQIQRGIPGCHRSPFQTAG